MRCFISVSAAIISESLTRQRPTAKIVFLRKCKTGVKRAVGTREQWPKLGDATNEQGSQAKTMRVLACCEFDMLCVSFIHVRMSLF